MDTTERISVTAAVYRALYPTREVTELVRWGRHPTR